MNPIKLNILSFFPPVRDDLQHLYDQEHTVQDLVYQETNFSYNPQRIHGEHYYNNPFNDNIPNEIMYNIIFNLGKFRIYINRRDISDIDFIMELNKLLNMWRPYLNSSLINYILQYNEVYNNFIKIAEQISIDHSIDKLSNDITKMNVHKKPNPNIDDISQLNKLMSNLGGNSKFGNRKSKMKIIKKIKKNKF
tara:strand:- start:291 stop:869 length:579 start_codon:yes stop_codon:yes gene_type:complete